MAVRIAEGVYWVGAVDWEVRNFHGHSYRTHRGTSYNAYLVVDEKIALVDTVVAGFEEEMFRRIAEVVDPARIDYLVANHGEPDHTGAIPAVLARAPQAVLVCSRRGVDSLGKYYPHIREPQVVGSGDAISLGRKTLAFLEAPMLHWPDSMFTYIPEDRLLLPNDAFGQHLASAHRFADEVEPAVLWDEARKYFANILTPFSALILRKVEEVQKLGLQIEVIAPSHGLIWRQNPMQIVEQYVRWARGEARPQALVVYETMWGSTAEMAHAIAEGIAESGAEVHVYALPQEDITTVVGALLEARGLVVGSATHNRRPLLHIAALMEDLVGLRPVNKMGAAFGSHGWGGGAVPLLEKALREAGIEVVQDGLALAWRPSAEERARAAAFGRAFGERVKSTGGGSG
ncbi:MAG: FprA family A-type flavoprotein [Chloroflexia bacterium]